MAQRFQPFPRVAERLAASAPLEVIAFGSSSTEGVGATSPAPTYPARLEVYLARAWPSSRPVSVKNWGRGGEDADDMAKRVPSLCVMRPDLVVWQTGSNDTLKGVDLAHFVELTRQGIERLCKAGSDILFLEPQYCPALESVPTAAAYRNALRALAAELRVALLRRYDLMRAWIASGDVRWRDIIGPDDLHMTDRGYDWLAREVAQAILAGARTIPG